MADSGTSLGADLYGLMIVANRNFPTVAGDYHAAQRAAASTSDMQGAFRRPDHFGGGPIGEAMTAWTQLRDSFVRVVTETATSLDMTADALRLAVQRYSASDQAAANELSRLMRVNGQPTAESPVPR